MDLIASLSSLQTLTGNFYIADFFDVFIIAVFIYSVLLLFKQTRSFSIIIGMGMILILYGVAQVFNFYLTSLFLRSFFGVFLLVLVVIFQEELRRFFELIALWSTRQRKREKTSTSSETIDAIIQAVSSLAYRKIGALIVITGNENIQRHIEGGIVLDGVVSQELIESIFDPTSPGHDGAVIILKDAYGHRDVGEVGLGVTAERCDDVSPFPRTYDQRRGTIRARRIAHTNFVVLPRFDGCPVQIENSARPKRRVRCRHVGRNALQQRDKPVRIRRIG